MPCLGGAAARWSRALDGRQQQPPTASLSRRSHPPRRVRHHPLWHVKQPPNLGATNAMNLVSAVSQGFPRDHHPLPSRTCDAGTVCQ